MRTHRLDRFCRDRRPTKVFGMFYTAGCNLFALFGREKERLHCTRDAGYVFWIKQQEIVIPNDFGTPSVASIVGIG